MFHTVEIISNAISDREYIDLDDLNMRGEGPARPGEM